VQSLSFPPEIQSAFASTYNLQLHVSYIFFVMSLCWTGIAMLYGLTAFIHDSLGVYIMPFTSAASTCLLISSAILTAVQSQATGVLNLYGTGNGAANAVGVMGGYGHGLLALTWSAFALSSVSSFCWGFAGTVSAALRGDGF
jgi:hypothetical protein